MRHSESIESIWRIFCSLLLDTMPLFDVDIDVEVNENASFGETKLEFLYVSNDKQSSVINST